MNEIIVVALINWMAFKYGDAKDNLFLWFPPVATNGVFGVYWAKTGTAGSSLWVEGVCIIVLSAYWLYRIVLSLWGRR